MKNKILKITPIIKIIVIFMAFSFAFGIMFALKINVKQIDYYDDQTFLSSALTCFAINFWFIFLLWLLGRTKGIFLICYLLVFLKCFLLGVMFYINLRSNHVFSFLKYFLLDLVFYFPLLGKILCDVSLNNFYHKNQKSPYNLIIVYVVWVFLYSLLCGVIRGII